MIRIIMVALCLAVVPVVNAQPSERTLIFCFTDDNAARIATTPVEPDSTTFDPENRPSLKTTSPRFPYEMQVYSFIAENPHWTLFFGYALLYAEYEGSTVVIVGTIGSNCEGSPLFLKERENGHAQYRELIKSGIPEGKAVKVVGPGLFIAGQYGIVPFSIEVVDDPDDGGSGGDGGEPETPEPVPPPNVRMEKADLNALQAEGGQSDTHPLRILTANGWRGEVAISHTGLEEYGIALNFEPSVLAHPGSGVAVAQVNIPLGTYPMPHAFEVILDTRSETGAVETFRYPAVIRVDCDTPFILGDDASHPLPHAVPMGDRTTLDVTVHRGSAPLRYQWYRGPRGSRVFPITHGTLPKLTTPPVYEPTEFWAEVTNPCGSTMSRSALISPTASGDESRSRGGRARPVTRPSKPAGPDTSN